MSMHEVASCVQSNTWNCECVPHSSCPCPGLGACRLWAYGAATKLTSPFTKFTALLPPRLPSHITSRYRGVCLPCATTPLISQSPSLSNVKYLHARAHATTEALYTRPEAKAEG